MRAIALIFFINWLLLVQCSSGAGDSNSTQSNTDEAKCHIDPRVSMLRCVSVPLARIEEALTQWNLTSITRLEITRGTTKSIDALLTGGGNVIDDNSVLVMREISIINTGLRDLGEQSLDGFDFNELESIDLSWNELMQVPQVVLRLGKLRHLDLSHNKIFSLPPGSSFNHLNALATLKLSGNK